MRLAVTAVWLLAVLSSSVAAQQERREKSGAEQLFSRVSSSVVMVEAIAADGKVTAFGSGVAIGGARVVTNNHVLADADRVQVRQHTKAWSAVITHVDVAHDLAMVSVVGLDRPAATLRASNTLAIGERVYAIGSPARLDLSISEGIISGLRVVKDARLVQTTAAISHGSSGGGLFDSSGRLIGITTFTIEDTQGLNFAIPAELIRGLEKHPYTAQIRPAERWTSIWSGLASNETSGQRATIRLEIEKQGTSLLGQLTVFAPLVGSGPIKGSVVDSITRFRSVGEGATIDWEGRFLEGRLVGEYTVRSTVSIPFEQRGSWEASRDFGLAATPATLASQQATMKRLREVAIACESYAVDHNEYPSARRYADLKRFLVPKYLRELPRDGWGRLPRYVVWPRLDHYLIASAGSDGEFDLPEAKLKPTLGLDENQRLIFLDEQAGPTANPNRDIIFADGQFIQWPKGPQTY